MKRLDQVASQMDGLRKFEYGDRVVAATIADELDFVIKNHAESFLAKIEKHHRRRGAILSCIGEQHVITQFHADRVEGIAEDEFAFNIRRAIKEFNPETHCVVAHTGRDTQACVKTVSIASLYGFMRQRIISFGFEELRLITTS